MIKSLIFDFGGTIDTDGIHWIEKFWDSYQQHSINVSRAQFIDAYIFAERKMNEKINMKDSFRTTITQQLSLQFEYLQNNNIYKNNNSGADIASECYADVENSISKFKKIIEKLENQYTLAVVSNFYGNLETVLDEFNIKNFFKLIIDSTVVKIRKPDPEIFRTTLKRLSTLPEQSFVIGDSYENDIKPAHEIGCGTIWLINKNYQRKENTFFADYKISSINQLRSILKSKRVLQQNNFLSKGNY
ncbi:MAG: HAD family hydrolase [Ignavibacteriaceae bacterium]